MKTEYTEQNIIRIVYIKLYFAISGGIHLARGPHVVCICLLYNTTHTDRLAGTGNNSPTSQRTLSWFSHLLTHVTGYVAKVNYKILFMNHFTGTSVCQHRVQTVSFALYLEYRQPR